MMQVDFSKTINFYEATMLSSTYDPNYWNMSATLCDTFNLIGYMGGKFNADLVINCLIWLNTKFVLLKNAVISTLSLFLYIRRTSIYIHMASSCIRPKLVVYICKYIQLRVPGKKDYFVIFSVWPLRSHWKTCFR